MSGCRIQYVRSSTDPKLVSYNDSLNAYYTGRDICNKLAVLYAENTNCGDYTEYFLNGWNKGNNFGDPVDTNLISNEFVQNINWPDTLQGERVTASDTFEYAVTQQLKRFGQINVKPYAKVRGEDLPEIYIYALPKIKVKKL